MAETIAASESERLPWLNDDHKARRGGGRWVLALLAATTMVVVAAVSFWLGLSRTQTTDQNGSAARPTATIPIAPPEAATEPAMRQPEPAPMPDVQPAPAPAPLAIPDQQDVQPSVQIAPPVARMMRKPATAAPRVHGKVSPAKGVTTEKTVAADEAKGLRFANPWESGGVSGRMVRIGTYGSLDQGKQAWSRIARVFPGLKKLPAVVTDIPSLRNGRTYYRLQIGTTSQAHSEVLCQRMRAIGQSCVVVDLAGARKGSWDDGQPAGL